MKTRRVISIAVLLCAAVTVSYMLGYRHGRKFTHQRLNSVSNLKQIGLSFRMGRNDLSGPFSFTGSVTVPEGPTQNKPGWAPKPR